MSNSTQLSVIEQVMLQGNLKSLTAVQKIEYYAKTCESLGLNPLTKPFEYIVLNGKEVLYATKGCTEQLRNIHGVSIRIVDKQKIDDIYIVTAEASNKDGRVDSATGAVTIAGLKGDSLANAIMKAETKAKRRVTLSLCGLNMLDELEVESIPNAKPALKAVQGDIVLPISGSPVPESVSQPEETTSPHESSGWEQFNGNSTEFNAQYTIPFGKYKGQTLESVGIDEAVGYANFLRKRAQEVGKQVDGAALEFLNQVDAFVAAVRGK